jgi:hypothetical protein
MLQGFHLVPFLLLHRLHDTRLESAKHLEERGWSQVLIADSGNGYHVIPLVQMDNTVYNAKLLLDVRKALANKFTCDQVKIDASVSNPARLTRAYGTMTRKGTSTPERPHRRNRMIQPTEPIQEIPLDQILQLACELPTESRQRNSRKMPVPRKDFDAQNYFEWFETKENHPRRQHDWKPAFEIVGKRESGGVTYFITDICLIAGHKHTGSKVTGFGVGDSFGYHCFSDDCEGITLRDLHAKLRAEGYELYPEPIFEDDAIEDVPDFAENAAHLHEAIDSVVGEKPLSTKTHTDTGTAPNVEKLRPDVEWLTKLLAVIFKDPKSAYGDFAVWRNRLQWLIDEKALSKTLRPVLELLLEYERKHRRLPTQDELIDAAGSNVGIVGVLSRISKIEEDITLDYAADKIVSIGEASDERRTALRYVELLEKGTEHSKAREYVRKRWSHGISADRALVEGSVQDHQDEIFERFRKMGMGEQDDNPLAFSTPFPTINDAILSDQERCCALIGPPNNFKTSVVLSLAYSLARQGKSTLLVTGEHEPDKLEERITLLHGFYKRERFTLPSYKEWSDGKVAEVDVRNMRECCDDWKALVSVPGPIVVRHMSEFGYDLGKIEAYMEETHRKYQWKALVIDPFGDLLINVDPKERWGKGGELCQKLLRMPVAGEGLSRVEMSQELPFLGTGASFARAEGRAARVGRLFMRTHVDNDDEPEVLAVVPLPSTAERTRREIMAIDIVLAGDPLGLETSRDLLLEVEHTFPELAAGREAV